MNKILKKRESNWIKMKRFLLGMNGMDGFLMKIVIYGLLVVIGFVFLYPILYMVSYSFKDLDDLLNAAVSWVPSKLYLGNFERAYEVLDYMKTFGQTLIVAILPSVLQMIVAAVVGYGFALYNFRGKNVLLVLVLATFVIPPQVTVIPRYILFNELEMLGSISSYALPAILGQGLNSAIFILIFYQTFRAIPKSLVEAARLDGANEFKIFYRIGLSMATSAFIITFLFSVVWYWNETYLASIYFGDSLTTLPLQLQKFVAAYNNMFPAGQGGATLSGINEGIELAATLLTIIPLLIIYFIAQKWFVQSIDKSGITGE
ncbi:carbohydrate ABC transporter permease [Listeria booriae]|uniref:Carbohydrate ABC transporter permease n=1 Tax=Listeria booriae TaxID=1552123 RepID=A0A7X0TK56_9LIST|nr:carbohydrate ABC transporter permease [Listeria booriae]MBC1232620.1 carbohydrate ABC transporter permease [Listeria booriae]MBC1246394.1 carbohydrate ABC transporter permease [Listeria booriae]MBC1330638.1 carbohydrate ABC transporter permease [Listeria booriae]MBC2385948.1 carbohydrate ABC transporter permease [Listeria booriae]